MLDFSKARVLVIGDIMLDKYWSGSVNRISPEGPIPVAHINDCLDKIGGAGNVALNLLSLGAKTHLIGMIGKDIEGKNLKSALKKSKIGHDLIETNQAPTITKLRVIGQNQQLIRLDFEKSYINIDKSELIKTYKKLIKGFDIILISDYAKGTLSNTQDLINIAKKAKKLTFIDPKGNDFTKYTGATLIKPNLKEFETIVGKCADQNDLIKKAKKLQKQLDVEYLMITQGAKGMTLISKNKIIAHEQAHAKEVYDVTGAGDTVIATLTAAISHGYKIKQAMNFSNMAASCVVQKLGAATVTPKELQAKINANTPIKMGILSRKELAEAVKLAQSIGKKVVFTNGCFDIVHAGHIAYLEKAKKQGDLLIVGVNNDASIKRLKGKDRPISTLESRLHVLAAFNCVDWVVDFHEDTPENLLELIKPDILVKGTDYKIHEIVGHEIVQGYGGEVRRISHEHGKYSTSEYIKKIKDLSN